MCGAVHSSEPISDKEDIDRSLWLTVQLIYSTGKHQAS